MKNIYRLEIYSKITDSRIKSRENQLKNLGFGGKIENIAINDIYTIDKNFTYKEISQIAEILSNPLIQEKFISSNKDSRRQIYTKKFDYALETGFLPGVTDNAANTAKEMVEDFLKVKFTASDGIYTSQIIYITGKVTLHDIQFIGSASANPLIKRIHIKSSPKYIKDKGMDFIIPEVKLDKKIEVYEVNLKVPDEELTLIGKYGIIDKDGRRQGPLALNLGYLKAIQKYFLRIKRNPTDIELESLAQTWSEHCKHTIFGSPIDEIKEGIFNHYIKRATEEIRKHKGKNDLCVSVFSDNSGAISFDDKYIISHKVETHNTPSALDPFGGSITGIVGVNRDAIGFGLGAKPVANFYGFCFADPEKDIPLYKDKELTHRMLSSRRILDGVVDGVNAGGNQSGIPTPQGFVYFDERYRGKPLIFVGTVGLIPKKIGNHKSYIKKAIKGDYIVMAGGRVGKDGIHGATFSSEALSSHSPVTAVQIGDPITQKKLSDTLVKEARDMHLFHSITDNGAGGLSCSVAEMAKESGGCRVDLEKVPLKYPGLAPWEIWISESQERMTLSVPPDKWHKFSSLMKKRGVEATIIGKFTGTGKCVVFYNKKKIMDIDMQFLHNGLPEKCLKTNYIKTVHKEPAVTEAKDLTNDLLHMIGRLNIGSFQFITNQYDYIVQGGLALHPLQGKGRINADATVIRPILASKKGIIMSQGLNPSYSDIDTYHMAAASIDTAIRNAVASGADIGKLCLLDNFCWTDSLNPYRLGQLKSAASACFEYATYYGTPFISGKDSMFNDFAGFDARRSPIKISIPPTLLISSLGIIEDIEKLVSLDAKNPGDLIYLLGDTYNELGASEYYAMLGEKNKKDFIGNNVPKTNQRKNFYLYKTFYQAVGRGLISSSISVGRGGIAVALAKTAMGGKLGMQVSLKEIESSTERDDFTLFSESQGRIIVTIDPLNKKIFEKIMRDTPISLIGKITHNNAFCIKGSNGRNIVDTDTDKLSGSYRKTFAGY